MTVGLWGKRVLARCWPRDRTHSQSARPRKVILLYHSVGNGPWATPEGDFRAQMEWLADHCRVVDLDRLVSAPGDAPLEVALTFDDGYAAVHDVALSILAALDMRAAIYLNTGNIGRERRASSVAAGHYPGELFMNWHDVARLAAAGWTVGSHGIHHVDLTTSAASEVVRELVGSKRAIENRLATPCRHFAYTWGRSTPRVRAAVADAGYETAAGARHGPLPHAFDRLQLPRMNIARGCTLRDFADIVGGAWDYLRHVHDLKAWRRGFGAHMPGRAA